MTPFSIIPPREPLTDSKGNITRVWWRFFASLFETVGSGQASFPLSDINVLSFPPNPPSTERDIVELRTYSAISARTPASIDHSHVGIRDTPDVRGRIAEMERQIRELQTLGFLPIQTPELPVNPYLVQVYSGAALIANQVVAVQRVPSRVAFPPNFGPIKGGMQSWAGCTTNATNSTTLNVQKCLSANDPTSSGNWATIGTVVIGAGGHSGSLATTGGGAQSVSAGDYLRIIGPATPDATAAGFFFTLTGTR